MDNERRGISLPGVGTDLVHYDAILLLLGLALSDGLHQFEEILR